MNRLQILDSFQFTTGTRQKDLGTENMRSLAISFFEHLDFRPHNLPSLYILSIGRQSSLEDASILSDNGS